MAIQCSAVFLVPAAASMAPPSGARLPAGALVVVPGAAFAMVAPGGASATTTTTARRVVLAAAPGVALPQGGGGPADARLRRGVVCFQAGGTPSSGDDEAKIEAVAFKAAMEAFEDTFRPLALVSSNEKVPLSLVENVLKEVKDSADGCGQLLRLAIHVVPITQEQLQELIGAGESFATLDGECMEGYLRAVSLVGAIDGAKRMCTVLSARIDNFLPIDTVSASGDDNDLDKEKYFTNLSKEFYCLYEHMCQKLYHHLHIVT